MLNKSELARIIKDDLNNEDAMTLHNHWCEINNSSGDEIYINDDDFLECFVGDNDLNWFACRCFYGDYCPAHEFVCVNGYGNLISSDFVSDLVAFDENALAEMLLDDPQIINDLNLDVDLDITKE